MADAVAMRVFRIGAAVVLAVMSMAWWGLTTSPASAHGENDARSIARDVPVGPYTASVWQVIGDHGTTSSAHVVVDFGTETPSAQDSVVVAVGAPETSLLPATPSLTSDGVWQTTGAVEFGDVIQVGVATDSGHWWTQSFTVPQPPGGSMPMRVLIGMTVIISAVAIVWLGRRARRAWRKQTPSSTVTT